MDEMKKMKSYILPKPWMTVVGAVMIALALVLCVMGLAQLGGGDKAEQAFHPVDSETGTMAYLDVVGVSDWLYNYDGAVYYGAEDADGFLYTLRLTEKQLKAMADQQAYWNRTSESEPQPEAYRLEGYVQKIPSDARENLADCYGITAAEYDEYFGYLILNATTTAGAENSGPWFLGALFAALIAVFCFIIAGKSKSVAKKCLARLEEKGMLDQAAAEFDREGNQVIGKNRGRLSGRFLYGKGTGAVIAYEDMIWAYKMNRRQNFVVTNTYLIVNTRKQQGVQAVDFGKSDRKGEVDQALEYIAQHNPNTFMGYSQQNATAYREIVRQQ